MYKYIIGLLAVSLINIGAFAQDKFQQDVDAIKSLCGCFEVDFDYTETFAPDTNYEFHSDYHAHALAELAIVVEEREGFISIQHLLVVGGSYVIKHWREDWIYENTDFYEFNKDLSWSYKSKSKEDVKGQWTQKVYQVDDSPRYEGTATWVHVDGRHFWENSTYSPLPRREYSHRSDYNVLLRGNSIELTAYGWLHEQDNTKIVRNENGDEVLAQEKGYNRYRLSDDSKCQAAREWWDKNQAYWAVVRAMWQEVFDAKRNIDIALKVGEEALWEVLFGIGEENEGEKLQKKKKIREDVEAAFSTYMSRS